MTNEEREKTALAVLEKLGIEYKIYRHEAIYTIEAAKELDKNMGLEICKNLFLRTRHSEDFYLLFMIGSKRFNSGLVSKQAGSTRLTFASDEELLEYLDIEKGSVTPLGLINDKQKKVNFLIDSDVLKMEFIAMHPCVNTATVIMKTEELTNKILPYCGRGYKAVEV